MEIRHSSMPRDLGGSGTWNQTDSLSSVFESGRGKGNFMKCSVLKTATLGNWRRQYFKVFDIFDGLGASKDLAGGQ